MLYGPGRPCNTMKLKILTLFINSFTGLKIQITYMGNQKRKYRVNGLTKLSAADQTFTLDNNEKVTVKNYFAKEKKVTLRYALFEEIIHKFLFHLPATRK